MYSHAFLVIGVLCGFLLVNTATSEAILWDLVITTNIDNMPVFTEDNIVVSGTVVDHANMPIQDGDIQIRIGSEKVLTTTTPSGEFHYELENMDLIPGIYVLNVVATSNDGKYGISNIEFRVKGESSYSSHTAKLLEAPEAQKYLYADESDFKRDPIGLVLFSYYQGLQEKFEEEEITQSLYDENNKKFEDLRQISEQLSQIIIDEANPGSGIYDGYKRDYYVAHLEPEIKEIVIQQLNYTIRIFVEAQKAMDEVLQNGGTYEDAQLAYFEIASTPKALVESLTSNEGFEEFYNPEIPEPIEDIIIESETLEEELEPEVEDEDLSVNIDGTEISVGLSGTTIFLNINGTMVEFVIEGNKIIQVTNSTQN